MNKDSEKLYVRYYKCPGCGGIWSSNDLFYSEGACLNYDHDIPDLRCDWEDELDEIFLRGECGYCGELSFYLEDQDHTECQNQFIRENKSPQELVRKRWEKLRPKMIPLVYAEHGENCLACGSSENVVIDHIIPISKDGTSILDNLQPLCGSCNRQKDIKTTDYRRISA